MRDTPAPAGGDTFGSILDRHRGEGPGFGILRLALAVLVLWFHSRYLARAPEPVAAVHSGIVAAIPQGFRPAQLVFLFLLPAFFALSGFLVTGSALRLRATIPFLTFRILRLLPALLVEVTLSALVLGPLFTNLPLREYFSDPQFFRYFGNIVGWITFTLPGVFASNYSNVVNANLWTLPSELDCYIITAALMITGLAYRRLVLTSIMVVVTIYLIISNSFYGIDNNNFTTHALTYYFFMGTLFYHWKEYIFASWKLFGVAVVGSYVFLSMPNTVYFAPIFVTYMTVFLGVRGLPEFKWLKTRDYSYGIYLYGSPITQAVLATAPFLRGHGIAVFILGTACSLAFAAMSWHLIERRALALKSRLPQVMTAKKVAIQAAAAE